MAFGAHPDDVEISAGGTVASLIASGRKVGIVDLTRGELGSRGSADVRDLEAAKAAQVLGVSVREQLHMRDGFFAHDEHNVLRVIQMIRQYRPDVVLANSETDRHPDHGRGAKLVAEAAFLSGLRRVETHYEGEPQDAWRPKALYHYLQDYFAKPHIVTDISDFFEVKMEAVRAFSSQFYDPNSEEPQTPISGEEFFDFLKSRAMQLGRPIGALYGEGFTSSRYIGTNDLTSLL